MMREKNAAKIGEVARANKITETDVSAMPITKQAVLTSWHIATIRPRLEKVSFMLCEKLFRSIR